MGVKFHGSLQELKDRLLPLDLQGDWEEQPNSVWKLKCKDKAGEAEFSEMRMHGPKITSDVAETIAEVRRNTLAAAH